LADGFDNDETIFLIILMGEHLESLDELPTSMLDLNRKIAMGRGQKKTLVGVFHQNDKPFWEKITR